jgi:hypothetical protein
MMRRPQFRLSTLLWITLALACWFGGMAVQKRIDDRHYAGAVFVERGIRNGQRTIETRPADQFSNEAEFKAALDAKYRAASVPVQAPSPAAARVRASPPTD